MVQGGTHCYISKSPSIGEWDNSARKSGFQAMQKKEQEKKEAQDKMKYGAWGPMFKNRDHFNNMHYC